MPKQKLAISPHHLLWHEVPFNTESTPFKQSTGRRLYHRHHVCFLKIPLNMDTIALGGQTSKQNGRGFQPQGGCVQFWVMDAVSTLGELFAAVHCSTPHSQGWDRSLPSGPARPALLTGGFKYSLLSSCWIACSMEHKPCYREPCFKHYKPNCQAKQHISVMSLLGR